MIDISLLSNKFDHAYGTSQLRRQCFFAPGRVNLIGEHLDYNGGLVLPAALSLGIYGMLRFRSDHLIQLQSVNASCKVVVDLKASIQYREEDGWGNYPKGVIKCLLDSGHVLQGCDILFYGDLPDGAGLSSSAAMLVLTAFMLRWVHGDHDINHTKLAEFCQKVENEFMNVKCGIMDQFAVSMGRRDSAILLDCETLKYTYIPFDLGKYSLVIMNTNKKRELSESNYNQRRWECEQALNLICSHHLISNLCQALPAYVDSYIVDKVLQRRANHVISEYARVLQATQFLKQGNMVAFGRLLTSSHLSLKNDYEVSGAELDCIVENALLGPGCIGARMTGAGFGGCAIALVESYDLENFNLVVSQGYLKETGRKPTFYVAKVVNGVQRIASL